MSPHRQNCPWLKTTALRPSSLHPKPECCTVQLEGGPLTVIPREVIPQSHETTIHPSEGAALPCCAMAGITCSGGRHADVDVEQKTRVENTDQRSTAFLIAFMNTASPLWVLLSIMHTQTHTEVWNPVPLFDMSLLLSSSPKKAMRQKHY